MPKNAEKYYCKLCDFGCSKQSNYDNHLSTRKHKMIVNDSKMIVKNAKINMPVYAVNHINMIVVITSTKKRAHLLKKKKKIQMKK